MSYCIPSCPFTFRGTPHTTKSRTSLKRMSLVSAHKASSGIKPADVVSIDLQAADSWLSCHMFALVTKCGLSPSSARRAHWNWTESRWRWNNTLKKDESQDALDIGMIQAWWSTFVLDVSGRKCAEVLFFGTGRTCSIDASAQLPRIRQLLSCWRPTKVTHCLRSFCELGRTFTANTPRQA